jgi:hypothetical protein
MELYQYIDGDGNAHTICQSDLDGTYSVDAEEGEGDENIELHIEESPNRYSSHYRGFTYTPRDYVLTLTVRTSSPLALEAAKRQWKTWHNRELGEGYVRRTLESGVVRCLDCIPGVTKWTATGNPSIAKLDQHYIAAWPFWRDNDATVASGTMNGSTGVNVSCANDGDIDAPLQMLFTGVCHTPRVTRPDATYQEFATAMANADDTITVDNRPYGETRYYRYSQVHGVGAETPVSAASGSHLLWVPRGTNNLVLTGAAGETSTATVDLLWHNQYASLY